MSDLDLCEVVITAPDVDWLYILSRELVQAKLAASAHNFTPVRSVYRWKGQVNERTEGRVSLHTSHTRVPEIVNWVKREHPYEVPSVSTRPITGGNPEYLAWIASETEPGPSETEPEQGLRPAAPAAHLLPYEPSRPSDPCA